MITSTEASKNFKLSILIRSEQQTIEIQSSIKEYDLLNMSLRLVCFTHVITQWKCESMEKILWKKKPYTLRCMIGFAC